MAKLIVVYDTRSNTPDWGKAPTGVYVAQMPVKANLKDHDIYTLARKLTEMFLEQLPDQEEDIVF